jgi:hypothetical protein
MKNKMLQLIKQFDASLAELDGEYFDDGISNETSDDDMHIADCLDDVYKSLDNLTYAIRMSQ